MVCHLHTSIDFTPSQYTFMRQLRIVNEIDMLHRVPSPWYKSHKWLINHQLFRSWTQYHGPRVLWLQGGPGSGKTVLSKAAVLYLSSFSESDPSVNAVRKTVYFSYDGSDPATRSSIAFARSSLYQILKDTKTAFTIRYLDDVFSNNKEQGEDILWRYLSSIIKWSRGVIFQFVIDAIGEIEPVQETNGVTLLERLAELLVADVNGHMKLLITERKAPDEKILKSASTSVIYVENENTRQAVQEYVCAQVRDRLANTLASPLVGARIENEIMKISGGNFLMASLTWKWFSNEAQIWSRDAGQLPLIQEYDLPHDLETFYCALLNGILLRWKEEVSRVFAALRVSSERLFSKQLSLFAVICSFDCSAPSFDPEAVEHERSEFEAYFNECCGYFVRKYENGWINFAHRTAKALFSSQPQLPENAKVLNQYTMSESDAHSVVFMMCIKFLQAAPRFFTDDEAGYILSKSRHLDLQACIKQMSASKSDIHIERKISCLIYASRNWFEHYLKATASAELDLLALQLLQSDDYSVFHELWTELHTFYDETKSYLRVIECWSSPLLSAITRGDSGKLIKLMIDSGSEVNFLGPEDITPLSWAILCDRQEAFLALMRSDAIAVNFGKRFHFTAAHYAATSVNPFYINYMVKDSRVNLNCRGEGHRTPLVAAISCNRLANVLLLLEQPHIDVWAKDSANESALALALRQPMWEEVVLKIMRMDWNQAMRTVPSIAKLLDLVQSYGWHQVENEFLSRSSHILLQVDNRTGLNTVSALAYHGLRTELIRYITRLSYDEVMRVATSGRYNLLHLCANQGWHDIVGELVTRFNLRPMANDHANRTLLHWAVEYDWPIAETDLQILTAGNINQRDGSGTTALHLAISKRNITVVRWLVAAQADIFAGDNRGFTPAHLAANEGYREGVELFMNLTKYDYGRTREGLTLVHLMSLWLDGSLIKRFVESRRTSVNSKDQKRCIPLHYATQTGNVSAARVLLEKGCQVNAKDITGQTALHHAIRSGQLALPPLLLENGADMDLVDLCGQTCLHLSIRYRHEEFTQWLISQKRDMIFEKDKFGFTPLHRACSTGTASEVLELLRCGADILELDSEFRTPLEHAVIGRNQSTIKLILQYRRTDDYRAREWIRSINTALRISIEREFPEIETILMEAGAWIADRSTVRTERFYVPCEVREDRWPLVIYTHWDLEYHADSYDPSTDFLRDYLNRERGPAYSYDTVFPALQQQKEYLDHIKHHI